MTSPKILVVEDENIVAEDLQDCLKNLGYTVSAIASSGEEALQKATEMHPDLVLMDIRLKGEIDGVEAAHQIQARFSIPVVYLTAHADKDTLQRAKVTEPFGYILKPFEERELYTIIEVALYKHKVEKDRERLIAELQGALAKVKHLSGFLPICASCKKIRDDQGYWKQVEDYIREHSEVEFTHSLCLECVKKLYPELYGNNK